ncbi:MAG: TPM domain-containing protein [Lachnospiraceae bacterium]|nr:TPM domain-containing protein [Lachnospiraceae bacterium]
MKQAIHKNYVLSLMLCLIMLIPMFSASAAQAGPDQYVIDKAGLLSEEETKDLEQECREVSMKHNVSVCVVTISDFDGRDIKDWQRRYFIKNKLGMGDEENGIMLAISMAERDWGLVGFGSTKSSFTTYGRERMAEIFLDDLSDGNYYDAFSEYVSLADEFLTEAEDGTPYDTDHKYKENIPIPFIILGSLSLSFILSLMIVLSWKRSMNTRISQEGASEYLKKDSFTLSDRSDIFLYHTVNRTKRQKEENHMRMDSDSSGTSGKF